MEQVEISVLVMADCTPEDVVAVQVVGAQRGVVFQEQQRRVSRVLKVKLVILVKWIQRARISGQPDHLGGGHELIVPVAVLGLINGGTDAQQGQLLVEVKHEARTERAAVIWRQNQVPVVADKISRICSSMSLVRALTVGSPTRRL